MGFFAYSICYVNSLPHPSVKSTALPSEDGQQGKRTKALTWREARVGLARPLESEDKLYVAQVGKYPEIVSQLFFAATLAGMGNETLVVAVADGAQGRVKRWKISFTICNSF